MDIEKEGPLDLDLLGEKLKLWFIEKSWTIQTDRGPTSYVIQATKDGKLRMFFSACRALIVICHQQENKTIVSVRQGSWSKNIWSNLEWLVLRGGTNLAFTLWSFEVQREFQHFVKKVLGEVNAKGVGGGGS